MPLYEYQCQSCGIRFERIQKYSDPLVSVCPTCGGAVEKLLSSPAFQFKGSGWYVTDYARKSGESSSKPAATDSESKTSDASSSASSESAASTDKADAKADAKPAEKKPISTS